MSLRSFSRVAGVALRPSLPDSPPAHKWDISKLFSKMSPVGSSPSVDHINKLMSSIYSLHPRYVTMFSINRRVAPGERSTIKGLRIGTYPLPSKNVTLVSGLPLQDPSTIGVALYIADKLSRSHSSSFPCNISFIPLAYPVEYEKRRSLEGSQAQASQALQASQASHDLQEPTSGGGIDLARGSPFSGPVLLEENTRSLVGLYEINNTCRPIEPYITRFNKYYVNIDVNMSTQHTSMQYKSNSLSSIVSRGKHHKLFSSHPLPTIPPDTTSTAFTPLSLQLHSADSLLSPILQSPSIVLSLRSTEELNDEQIVARGEEVIMMTGDLMTD